MLRVEASVLDVMGKDEEVLAEPPRGRYKMFGLYADARYLQRWVNVRGRSRECTFKVEIREA